MDDIQVKVTPETLLSISADVTQKIAKVQNAFGELDSIIRGSGSYWEGRGQSAFAHAYELRENYEKILKSFQEHIVNLQQIAGVYRETEAFAEDLSLQLESNVIE